MADTSRLSETEPMTGQTSQRLRRSTSARAQKKCLGRKCCVVTVIVLFLFLTFIALPAGIFLIIHGGKSCGIGCVAGGAMVVCLPIVAAVVLITVFYGRRQVQRKQLREQTNPV
ncbi:uncharacterized protein LOC121368421 isoform X1 [Gigantopelta aegis]|uniref:uncharacterized protein LOC121368421 isoform X1 n=1 Tax=Gigantopelta aegis TaxID=1735272 RepID=UPI001B888106|nr:uncharacterized protein LOC121368421 isoform X1 [Gigantopelta aegis]